MTQIGVDNNLQKEMAKINSVIDMLKEKHGISVREHLGFGNYNYKPSLLGLLGLGNAATEKLKFHTDWDGEKRIG